MNLTFYNLLFSSLIIDWQAWPIVIECHILRLASIKSKYWDPWHLHFHQLWIWLWWIFCKSWNWCLKKIALKTFVDFVGQLGKITCWWHNFSNKLFLWSVVQYCHREIFYQIMTPHCVWDLTIKDSERCMFIV